jgi:hypothetical protein
MWRSLRSGRISLLDRSRARNLLRQLETLRPSITADEFRYAPLLID